MEKPKTNNKELILEYMEHRCPKLNSRASITEDEKYMVLDTFDRFNEFLQVKTIARLCDMTPERTKTVCFYLCTLGKMEFETRETNPKEFKHAKHGRATWVFRCAEEPKPIRLVPNSPLFNLPDSSRDRLETTLNKLKEDLRRYGLECDTLKIGDTLQIHVKGTPGGLLVAAKHMAQRSF